MVLPAGGSVPPQVAGSDQRVPLPTGGSGAAGGGAAGGEPDTGGIGVLGGGMGVAGGGVGAGLATGGVDGGVTGGAPGAGVGLAGTGVGVGVAAGVGAAGAVAESVLSPPEQAARVAVNSTASARWRIWMVPSES